MKTSLVILILAIGGLAAGLTRQREIQSLRRQITESKDKLAFVTDLRERNTQLQGAAVDTNQIKLLRSERNELMKLRAEIAPLRAANQSSPEELRLAIQNVRAEAEKERKRGEFLQASEAAAEESNRVVAGLAQLIEVARELSGRQPDQMATSFEELKSKAEAMSQKSPFRHSFTTMLASTNPMSAIFQKFEFISKASGSPADKRILLRERNARPQPNGGWAKAYAFSDGDVQEFVLPDGRFDVLEQQLMERSN